MFFISKKRFRDEVERRVCEAEEKYEERRYRNDREREMQKAMADLEQRVIAVEKKNGIDHPSHHMDDNCKSAFPVYF